MKFGEKIEKLRKEKKITSKKALAMLCGWEDGNTSARIVQYISGVRIPEPEDVKKLAKAFQISLEELIEDTDYSKILFIEKSPKVSKVPLVVWHQIPHICKNPDLLFSKDSQFIDISFQHEKNLFASIIPQTIVPGQSSDFFRPSDVLLISPERLPASSQHVVLIEKGWLEPIFAHYWLQGETPTVRYPWEVTLKKLNDKMKICGVVVARINIFI